MQTGMSAPPWIAAESVTPHGDGQDRRDISRKIESDPTYPGEIKNYGHLGSADGGVCAVVEAGCGAIIAAGRAAFEGRALRKKSCDRMDAGCYEVRLIRKGSYRKKQG
jgi:hypothetical protein